MAMPPLNLDYLRSGMQFATTEDELLRKVAAPKIRPRSSSQRLSSFYETTQTAVTQAAQRGSVPAAPAPRVRSKSFGAVPRSTLPIVHANASEPETMVNTTFLTSGRQFKTDPLATTVPEREREWHTHNVKLDRFYQMTLEAAQRHAAHNPLPRAPMAA